VRAALGDAPSSSAAGSVKPTVERVEVADARVVRLTGEHDLATAAEVRAALEAAAETGEPVVCDLSRAEFVDSAILAALVSADLRLRRTARRLIVVLPAAAAPTVRTVFDVSGLSAVLVIAETVAAATPPSTPSG